PNYAHLGRRVMPARHLWLSACCRVACQGLVGFPGSSVQPASQLLARNQSPSGPRGRRRRSETSPRIGREQPWSTDFCRTLPDKKTTTSPCPSGEGLAVSAGVAGVGFEPT